MKLSYLTKFLPFTLVATISHQICSFFAVQTPKNGDFVNIFRSCSLCTHNIRIAFCSSLCIFMNCTCHAGMSVADAPKKINRVQKRCWKYIPNLMKTIENSPKPETQAAWYLRVLPVWTIFMISFPFAVEGIFKLNVQGYLSGIEKL